MIAPGCPGDEVGPARAVFRVAFQVGEHARQRREIRRDGVSGARDAALQRRRVFFFSVRRVVGFARLSRDGHRVLLREGAEHLEPRRVPADPQRELQHPEPRVGTSDFRGDVAHARRASGEKSVGIFILRRSVARARLGAAGPRLHERPVRLVALVREELRGLQNHGRGLRGGGGSVGKSRVRRDRGKRDLAAPSEPLRCRERRTGRTVHSVVSVMLTPFWPSSVAPTHAKAHAHAHARIASTSNDRRMVLPPTPAARSNNGTRERDETRRQRNRKVDTTLTTGDVWKK